MAFKPFTEYFRGRKTGVLTLRTSCSLFISQEIIKKHSRNDIPAAIIYVDDEKPRIGIKIIDSYDKDNPEHRKLNKEKTGYSLNIIAILNYYNLPKPTKKVNFDLIEENSLIVLDLTEVRKCIEKIEQN